jgi:hypothetical protein
MGRVYGYRCSIERLVMEYMGYTRKREIHTQKVILECSRCGGCGYQNPLDVDSPICFSCMGAGCIEVKK